MRGTTGPEPNAPCVQHDGDLWFAEHPAELNRAKQLCDGCPVKQSCLADALRRHEPWGVWGGEILQDGAVLSYKRGRGRPSKADVALRLYTRDATGERVRSRRERAVTTPGRAGTCHSRSA